jgi:hypothetical protein
LCRLTCCTRERGKTTGRTNIKEDDLSEQQSIEIAVMTDNQDDVEFINGTLRDAGHTAHCHWIKSASEFDKFM